MERLIVRKRKQEIRGVGNRQKDKGQAATVQNTTETDRDCEAETLGKSASVMCLETEGKAKGPCRMTERNGGRRIQSTSQGRDKEKKGWTENISRAEGKDEPGIVRDLHR